MKKISSFTSIEIIVVLAIISLFLGLSSVYYFNFKSAAALKLSAYEVVATLNQARSLAITTQMEHSVVFDTANNTYKIQDSSSVMVDEEHRLGEGISFDLINFPSNTATYSVTGSANYSRRVILKDNKNKYYTIKVLNTTGRVKVLNFRELPDG